jgi:hypothetical protein
VVFGQEGRFAADSTWPGLTAATAFGSPARKEETTAASPSPRRGDINGDGFDDVIIGASGADPNDDSSGASYVVFGQAEGFDAT